MKVNTIAHDTLCLQTFRCIFIVAIMCLHLGKPILGEGSDLCSFFFVVAGLCCKPIDDQFAYYKKKFKSLFPKYWFVLFIALIVSRPSVGFDIIPHLLLLQSYIPVSDTYFFKYLSVAWFLSSLTACYYVAPYILKMVNRITRKRLGLCICALTVLFIYFNIRGGYRTWFIYVNPLYRIIEFTMGVFLQQVIRETKFPGFLNNNFVFVVVISSYLLLLHFGIFGNISSILHILAVYFICSIRTKFKGIILENRYVIKFSKHLMWLYLTHQSIGYVVLGAILGEQKTAIKLIGAIVIALTIEYCYFLAMKFIGKIMSNKL